ncbi:unnamed protein product [Durusdinium trenchii]
MSVLETFETRRICTSCAEELPKEQFSGSQWRKESSRCKNCIRTTKNPPKITDSRLLDFVEECQRAKEQYKQSQTHVVSEITPWLCLGGALQDGAWQLEKTTHGICAALERNVSPVMKKLEHLLILNLEDKGSEAECLTAFKIAVAFAQKALEEPECKIYVFCALGCNRSAIIVMALLMAVEGLTLDVALKLVREKRPAIRPKYMRVLADFEIELGRECSRPEFLEAPDSKSIGALF